MSDDKKFGSKAKGIMEGLEEENEEKQEVKEEKKEESKEEKNKRVKEEKNKEVKAPRKKRSFTLTPGQVEKIYLLKAKNNDMTLSEIVGEAIEEYYEKRNS